MLSTFFIDYISGVAGGIVVCFIGHPFDTTKTRLQTAPAGFYKNSIDAVQKTWKWEGISGFYSGIYSPLVGQMIFRACSFSTFYHTTRTFTNNSYAPPSAQVLCLSGGITGFVISLIETPIDLVKTKLQVQIFRSKLDPTHKPAFSSAYGCFRLIIASHGVSGLWQGWVATAIRNTPANAVFFPVNELVKRNLASSSGVEVTELRFESRLAAGACAGLCYWVGTYPLDVVKGRIQAQPFEAKLSWLNTAKLIYKENGIRGFARGIVPCAMRSIPACSAMFFTVDFVREKLNPKLSR